MVLEHLEEGPLVVHTKPAWRMNENEFFEFCQINRELRIERNADGDLIFMAPAGGSSGNRNAKLIHLFVAWAEKDGAGEVFDSSTGFTLPNGAMRSPDVAWVRNERLESLTESEWNKFLPLCPDFVLELRSPSDALSVLGQKMEEYLANGALLGWLLDPVRKQVHIYRPNSQVELLNDPEELSGDSVLNGLILPVRRVWRKRG